MSSDKALVDAALKSGEVEAQAKLATLRVQRETFSALFDSAGKDGPLCYGEVLPKPLAFSPLDYVVLSPSAALFGTGLETLEAVFDHLRVTERFPQALDRVALVRNLFDRTEERKHLSDVVSVFATKSKNYAFVDAHVVNSEKDHPRLVCEYTRNTKGVLVQTTNNVPLTDYLKQLGLVVVPVAAKHIVNRRVPVWNLLNEALVTTDQALATELAASHSDLPVKVVPDNATLSEPFLRVGLSAGLSILRGETTSDFPLHYNLRTSVVESAKNKAFDSQTTNSILLVAPVGFQLNPETAVDNHFMNKINKEQEEIQRIVLDEFRQAYLALRNAGVNVIVKVPEVFHKAPDAVFPNNWFSTHAKNNAGEYSVVFYPMKAPSRQNERRFEISAELQSVYAREIDLTIWEKATVPQYLEGTGVFSVDRIRKRAYASLSERCGEQVCKDWARRIGYDLYLFHAVDDKGRAFYHTNVMITVGTTVAVACYECIPDKAERDGLRRLLESHHTVIEISYAQVLEMCGNVLEVRGTDNKRLMAMSTRAYNGFTPEQRAVILQHTDGIVHAPITTIENIGGGSLRCMMAEIF